MVGLRVTVGDCEGACVGESVLGEAVGATVLGELVGDTVGDTVVGDAVGATVLGELVGDTVGAVVGETVGDTVLGSLVGLLEGEAVVGVAVVGLAVGKGGKGGKLGREGRGGGLGIGGEGGKGRVGLGVVGEAVGASVGVLVGLVDGARLWATAAGSSNGISTHASSARIQPPGTAAARSGSVQNVDRSSPEPARGQRGGGRHLYTRSVERQCGRGGVLVHTAAHGSTRRREHGQQDTRRWGPLGRGACALDVRNRAWAWCRTHSPILELHHHPGLDRSPRPPAMQLKAGWSCSTASCSSCECWWEGVCIQARMLESGVVEEEEQLGGDSPKYILFRAMGVLAFYYLVIVIVFGYFDGWAHSTEGHTWVKMVDAIYFGVSPPFPPCVVTNNSASWIPATSLPTQLRNIRRDLTAGSISLG